jgi:hypothetical protein
VLALAVGALLAVPPSSAFAQDLDTMAVPKFEASAGYAFMRDISKRELTGFNHINFPTGWYGTAAFNPTEWLGLVGEVAGNYRNDLDIDMGRVEPDLAGIAVSNNVHFYTGLGGPRFFHKIGRVVPFGQVLVGVAQLRIKSILPAEFAGQQITETDWNFAIQPGGGATVYLTERMGVRLAADYRSMIDFNSEDTNDYYNALRVVSGFTLQWGGR